MIKGFVVLPVDLYRPLHIIRADPETAILDEEILSILFGAPHPKWVNDDCWASDGWKECSLCGLRKTLEEFSPNKRGSDGRRSRCRDCIAAEHRRKRYWQKDIEKTRERNRKWASEHKLYYRASSHRRQARIRGNGGNHTEADLIDIYFRQGGNCYYCGKYLSLLENGHFDHMTPLSRGGSNGPENIVWACAFCNLSKHDKTAEEFMAGLHQTDMVE